MSDISAIELKTLLLSWKLEKLYETLRDEDIFVEELEMMTIEHLESLLISHKMGVRIRFEHNFKKWRNLRGKPLDGAGIDAKCYNCDQQKNIKVKTELRSFKTIETKQQGTQTDHNFKTTKFMATQTMAESNDAKPQIVKVLHGAEQIRQVLNRIDKYKTSDTIKDVKSLIPTTITQTTVPISQPNNLNIEQPTSTFQDTTTATTSSMQTTNTINQNLLLPSQGNDEFSTSSSLQKTQFILPKTTATVSPAKQANRPVIPKASLTVADTTLRKTHVTKSPSKSNKSLKRQSLDISTPSTSVTALKKTAPDTTRPIIPKASLHNSSKVQHEQKSPSSNHTVQLCLLRKYANRSLQKCKEQLKLTGISVLKILIESGKEGQTILAQYEENPLITSSQREMLIDIICDYYQRNNALFNLETSYKLEEQILELFPSEKIENYRKDKHGIIFKKYFCIKQCVLLLKKQHTTEPIPIEDSDSDNSIKDLNVTNFSNIINSDSSEIKTEYLSD